MPIVEKMIDKTQYIPYVDVSATGSSTEEWVRIGNSTIFDLVYNAEIITFDFIKDKIPRDFVDKYKPTMAQEIAAIEGDPAFDALFQMSYDLPTGTDAVKDFLLVFPVEKSTGSYMAWKVESTIILKNQNSVDKKILFDINFAGDIKRGVVSIIDEVPTFIED